MRKFAGALIAVAMVVPVGLIAAGPAGGATTGVTCTTLGGTVKWVVPVPKAPATIKQVWNLNATFAGCSGTTGITSGVVKLPTYTGATKTTNCTSIVSKPTNFNVKAGGTIVWNNKSKSTLGPVVLKPAGLATYAASGKVASGQFAGKSLAVTGTFIPTTGCPFNTAKLSVKKGTKITIK